jgi:uncharacterized protein YcbK (DUF882 family)
MDPAEDSDRAAAERDIVCRRQMFRMASGLAAACALSPVPAWARRLPRTIGREVSLLNLHTGERLQSEFWYNGRYVPGALHAIAVLLRDHRTNQVHPIDPRLLDVIYVLHSRVRSQAPFNVVSGYRSPETNALLHEISAGVAVHSMHIEGKAIDLRLPGTGLGHLKRAALDLKAGGVGYYPADDFVHVDTGPLRHWG